MVYFLSIKLGASHERCALLVHYEQHYHRRGTNTGSSKRPRNSNTTSTRGAGRVAAVTGAEAFVTTYKISLISEESPVALPKWAGLK